MLEGKDGSEGSAQESFVMKGMSPEANDDVVLGWNVVEGSRHTWGE